MTGTPPDKTPLFEWLNGAIDAIPVTGQITLNFDGDAIKWEVKEIHDGRDRNGEYQRTEVRRFGRLMIPGRNRFIGASPRTNK